MYSVFVGISLFALMQAFCGAQEVFVGENANDSVRKAGETRDDNGRKIKFVWCPAGRFIMGTPIADRVSQLFQQYEGAVEVVLTRGFWMAQTEITQSQWQRVMGTAPWIGRPNVAIGDTVPATYVSWNRAREFCIKLTEEERKAGRLPMNLEYQLPTEAEWEYACRAGTRSRFSFGNDEADLKKYGWGEMLPPDHKLARPVALKQPNPWGLYDMHGNVREWCLDVLLEALPGGSEPVITAGAVEEGVGVRIVRGGDWNALFYHSAYRNAMSSNRANAFTGFRIVLGPGRDIKWREAELKAEDEFDQNER
jgi:formylglycine-generating enzyme required for sulfatase activity